MKTSGISNFDKDNAIKQIEVLVTSIKQTLLRVYKMTSRSFHVLIQELIPRARYDQSNLFTHIKGARTEHMLELRAHHANTRGRNAQRLTAEQLTVKTAFGSAHLGFY